MNNIEKFIRLHSLDSILKIEEQYDFQYIALKKIYLRFKNISDIQKAICIFLVVQNALISYQLSWKWEERWNEFSNYLSWYIKNWGTYKNIKWRNIILFNCTNNHRLFQIKLDRIRKTYNFITLFKDIDKIYYYYKNMDELNIMLSKWMNQNKYDKTIVFAVKMFWYICRIIFNKTITFPMSVSIPLDSRIQKIYSDNIAINDTKINIINYFNMLWNKYWIPPLHLDSLLWIKYWNNK